MSAFTLIVFSLAVSLTKEEAQREISKLVVSGPMRGADIGLQIRALGSPDSVFEHNSDRLLVPASNTKVITSVAALDRLGPEFRFRTELSTLHPVTKGVVDGDLFIKGGGDPALVSERVWYMVNELWHHGVREVRGDLVGDDSWFDDQRREEGWDEDRSDQAYQALTSALSVNFNTLTLRLIPGVDKGPLQVVVDPPSARVMLDAKLTRDDGKRSRLDISLEPNGGAQSIKVRGRANGADVARGYWRKVDEPTDYALSVIATFMQRAGITLKGGVRRGLVPPEANTLMAVESPRLAEVIDDLNKTSNNFVAEQIVKTLGAEVYSAPGSFDKGLRVMSDLMDRLGYRPGSFQLRNGSGLGTVNRISARQLVSVLEYGARHPDFGPEFISSLGIAGRTGTMRHRMLTGPGFGRVRAKTGTLTKACTLSGFAYGKSGQVWVFAILVNDYRKASDAHAFQDAIGHLLAQL